MPSGPQSIVIATRGSALALAQANLVFDQCRKAFPQLRFKLKIIRTTGDKLLTASLAQPDASLPKGLFTKELEVALLKGRADLAVHSLKDLPTELPAGLKLGAVTARADVRDVLVYRDQSLLDQPANKPDAAERSPRHANRRGLSPHATLHDLPRNATIATSSPRRKAQLLTLRPDLRVTEIRGNVITRLKKLADLAHLDGLILAAAGLFRLHLQITPEGRLTGRTVPDGLLATPLGTDAMVPCVGQAALGIEVRANDERIDTLCKRLNDDPTFQCVTAERAFLRAMGGGCQSPVAAHARLVGDQDQLEIEAVSFRDGSCRRAKARSNIRQAEQLGLEIAAQLR